MLMPPFWGVFCEVSGLGFFFQRCSKSSFLSPLEKDTFDKSFCNGLVRGALKIHFRKKLVIWPNQQAPPPPSPLAGPQKKEKKLNVYFAF